LNFDFGISSYSFDFCPCLERDFTLDLWIDDRFDLDIVFDRFDLGLDALFFNMCKGIGPFCISEF